MTIEQTVEIPANRQLVLNLPPEMPVGRARAALVLTYEDGTGSEREAALANLLGCCAASGDSLDAYMERHWADNDIERAIELRREKERERREP